MALKLKNAKGQYGYLDKQKKREILKTILLFGLSLFIYLTGLLTTHTNKNFLTFVAILGCIPASNSAVRMVMFFRASGCSQKAFESISATISNLPDLYDLYFTSYSKNFSISHAAYAHQTLIFYSENSTLDQKAFQNHIQATLTTNGYKDITIHLFQNLEQYLKRIESLQQLSETSDSSAVSLFRLLLNISL